MTTRAPLRRVNAAAPERSTARASAAPAASQWAGRGAPPSSGAGSHAGPAPPVVVNIGAGSDTTGTIRIDPHGEAANHPGDAENTGLPDGCADTVLMTNVLEHLPNPGRALSEAFRVLKPGAKLDLRTDNAACVWYHTNPREHRWEDFSPHFFLFKPHHLADLLKLTGFVSVEVSYEYAGTEPRVQRWLLPRRWVAQHLRAVAFKGSGDAP